ncbi:MAG: helix-turn-helix transcriptional regulator [Lachnospiraceae bacterium]|nr:helix-turn-helix transcriptional regulator [Lachnospiraceae bacterium]
MTLEEKITLLRKQMGWSQEELADRLDISRQAVSKWESGASTPELDKIIRLSELFGVSTDYLLKNEQEIMAGSLSSDDAGSSPVKQPQKPLKKIASDEIYSYLNIRKLASRYIALGTSLCILSPICLIFLSYFSENGKQLMGLALTENMASGIGMSIMFVMIAIAVSLFIIYGMQLEKYDYLEKEAFLLEKPLAEEILQAKEDFAPQFRANIAIGTVMCILAVIPMFLALAFGNEGLMVACVAFLLVIIAFAVPRFIIAGMTEDSFSVLLQIGEYKPENKSINDMLSGAYWCIITALYLGISFSQNNWHISWLIWPISALIYGALTNVLGAVIRGRKKNNLSN